jgi:CubicO group peptidase (beta-lactamase class C family)
VVSHTLCSGVFVSGLDPDRLYVDALLPSAGIRWLSKRLTYAIDRNRRQVAVTWAGGFESRAVYRDGLGCVVMPTAEPAGMATAGKPASGNHDVVSLQQAAAPLEVQPATAKLELALDHAFAEPSVPPYRRVKAIVILRDGKIVAERYAPGYGAGTPLPGYSVSKSVTSALIGILVRQGKLRVDEPAPVPEWRDPGDPRHAITVDQLLRMTSGLALDESDSGFDPVARMLFLEPDMAGFAARARLQAPPGSTWNYTSGNTLILSRIIRDAVGGRAEDVIAFARRELFEPLGIGGLTMEFDMAGTPVGSTYMLAPARDWARFGMLYLDDGVAGNKRILPEGWVKYSASPTLDSAYGAGFWTNAGSNEDARWRVRSGMPADSFYASGNLGQRIVMVPSAGLVIVRMGFTHSPGFDMRGLVRLVAEAIAAGGSP